MATTDPRTLSPELTDEDLVEMLRRMLRIRLFDEEASELQAKGIIPGPVHMSIGQEAEVVGACMALTSSDYILGNHRSHWHPIGKGAKLAPLMAELLGKATGVCGGMGGSMHLADFSVGSLGESGIVGSNLPITVGAALSAKLRDSGQVALSFFGDGAVNTGPFHEALNLASVWKVPAIFLCENNGYAVMTPISYSCSVDEISTRAISYNMPGVIVDGQDVLAVHGAVAAAVARARAGEGPTLLDVKTYRYRHHAEFGRIDNALRPYRTDEEVATWVARDPITIFAQTLAERGVLDEAGAAALNEEVREEVAEAVQFAQDSPYPELEAAFENMYVNPIPIRR